MTVMGLVPRSDGSGQPHDRPSVCRALAEMGVGVSEDHLFNLMKGNRDNPSAVLVAGLAEVFGVPVRYFFDANVSNIVKELHARYTAADDL